MKKMLKTTVMVIAIIVMALGTQTIAKAPIKVVVDRKTLTLDQPPATENERVLLPLRATFEALGAEVEWDDGSQTVTATKDKLVLKLEIGKRQASVNGKKVMMDVPGKMINGRTMVPVRFVAENLGVIVNWDGKDQKVIITTIGNNIAASKGQPEIAFYRNANLQDDYIEINIKEDQKIKIQGKTLSNNQYVLVEVLDGRGKEYLTKQFKIKSDKSFKDEYSVNLNDGKYTINVYMNDKEHGNYQGIHTGIIIYKTKTGMTFESSPVYENNLAFLGKSNKVSASDLNMHSFSEKDKVRLSELASKITQGMGTDYYKALAVSGWVSENIYYDFDALNSGRLGKTDAIGTLDERRSICQGYAALTTGLLRSIGIPTKLVFGYSLGFDSGNNSWDQVDHRKPNHVWNEVFLDGRWVIVDTTWNSKNKYEKGKYTKANKIYAYFDPTVETFSNTHKITNR